MRGLIRVVVLLLVADVYADAAVDVCYNYGCAAQTSVTFSTERLLEVAALLSRANSPTAERALLGQALGRLYAWAGEQSPIASDRHGNYADDGVEGRMDCIDHSLTTTRMLSCSPIADCCAGIGSSNANGGSAVWYSSIFRQ